MSYSKIDAALRAVLPDGVFRLEAPERPGGIPLTRYIVWTPTGSRSVYAEGSTAIRIYSAVVTVVSQTDDDPLVGQVLDALHGAHVAVGSPAQEYAENEITSYVDIPCEVI